MQSERDSGVPHQGAGVVGLQRQAGQLQVALLGDPSPGEPWFPWSRSLAGEGSWSTACRAAQTSLGCGVEACGEPVGAGLGRDAGAPASWVFYPARVAHPPGPSPVGWGWYGLTAARRQLAGHPLAGVLDRCVAGHTLPPWLMVDADGCPRSCLSLIEAWGARYQWPVVTVASFHHRIERRSPEDHVQVSDEPEAADLALANRLLPGDILVTPDYGLAALALGRGARALSPHGRIYTTGDIDFLLAERHLKATLRRQGGRTRGPNRRTPEDDRRFSLALCSLLQEPPTSQPENG